MACITAQSERPPHSWPANKSQVIEIPYLTLPLTCQIQYVSATFPDINYPFTSGHQYQHSLLIFSELMSIQLISKYRAFSCSYGPKAVTVSTCKLVAIRTLNDTAKVISDGLRQDVQNGAVGQEIGSQLHESIEEVIAGQWHCTRELSWFVTIASSDQQFTYSLPPIDCELHLVDIHQHLTIPCRIPPSIVVHWVTVLNM